MHRALIVIGVLVVAGPAMAQYSPYGSSSSGRTYGTGSNPSSTYVQPHSNSNGTYTQGHQRTLPNSTQNDNYGSRGNVNPYNGQVGTRSPRW